MVRRTPKFCWLPSLALGLLCAGCAPLTSRPRQALLPSAVPTPPEPTEPLGGSPPAAPSWVQSWGPSLQITDSPRPNAQPAQPNFPIALASLAQSPAPGTGAPASVNPQPSTATPPVPSSDPRSRGGLAQPSNPIQPVGRVEPPPQAKRSPEPAPLPSMERIVPVAQNAAPAQPVGQLRTLHRLAEQRYATTEGYIVRFKRREVIAGKNHPDEIILLKFRKEPASIYMRWLGGEGKGRELVYAPGRHGNVIHSLAAPSDMPFPGITGKHVKAAPDHPQVLARCRYPISETGIGSLIDRFGRIVDALERGETRVGSMRCLGQVRRPEFDVPVDAVLQLIPPGVEKTLPRGGQRFWFFDTNLRFPILMVAQDDTGNEVEYYCYDRFLFPDRFRDEEFDPERLWGR